MAAVGRAAARRGLPPPAGMAGRDPPALPPRPGSEGSAARSCRDLLPAAGRETRACGAPWPRWVSPERRHPPGRGVAAGPRPPRPPHGGAEPRSHEGARLPRGGPARAGGCGLPHPPPLRCGKGRWGPSVSRYLGAPRPAWDGPRVSPPAGRFPAPPSPRRPLTK